MEYPIVDWELAIKLAGNNLESAKELLTLLIKTLPTELTDIKQAYLSTNNKKLAQYVHRLHGALCYCGVPRLKAAAHQLESALKQNELQYIDNLFATFEYEADRVVRYKEPINVV